MMSFLYAATIDLQGRATDEVLAGSETTFAEWLSRIFGAILAVSALMVLIFLLWGAISWITSGGDKGKLEGARNRITQAIIGLIVLVASTAIFMMIQAALGIKVLNITSETQSSEKGSAVSPGTTTGWGRLRPNPTGK